MALSNPLIFYGLLKLLTMLMPDNVFRLAFTNGLMSESIMGEIHNLAVDKTVILISHRLANVTGADSIYVMDGGNIVERGRHEELLERGGVYARLWNTQQSLERYGKEDRQA